MPDDINSPDVAGIIRARAQLNGASPEYIARLFQIESGGNPNVTTGSNRGLGQFGPQEEAKYGITDANRTSADAQSAAVTREAADHAAILRKTLGRDPTPGEMYLTHQQGMAGGPALLSANPDMPAWQAIRPYYKNDAIAKRAITGNVPGDHPMSKAGADNITAQAFRDMWVQKFERGLPGSVAPTAPAVGGNPAVAPVASAGPAQTGQVPVAPENVAGGDDELLRTLQTLSAPTAQRQSAMPPMTINFPQPPGLQRARALALAMGRERIA